MEGRNVHGGRRLDATDRGRGIVGEIGIGSRGTDGGGVAGQGVGAECCGVDVDGDDGGAADAQAAEVARHGTGGENAGALACECGSERYFAGKRIRDRDTLCHGWTTICHLEGIGKICALIYRFWRSGLYNADVGLRGRGNSYVGRRGIIAGVGISGGAAHTGRICDDSAGGRGRVDFDDEWKTDRAVHSDCLADIQSASEGSSATDGNNRDAGPTSRGREGYERGVSGYLFREGGVR